MVMLYGVIDVHGNFLLSSTTHPLQWLPQVIARQYNGFVSKRDFNYRLLEEERLIKKRVTARALADVECVHAD